MLNVVLSRCSATVVTSSLDVNKRVKKPPDIAEVKGKLLLKKLIQGFLTTETIWILPCFSTADVCALRLVVSVNVEV